MQTQFWLDLSVYAVVLLTLAWPLSAWLARVASPLFGQRSRFVQSVERPLWRLAGIDPARGQRWPQDTLALLLLNGLGVLAGYLLQRVREGLPLNPAGLGAVEQGSAVHTAVTCGTNTTGHTY